MATGTAFEWLCDELEAGTELDRLAARGTVRLALKQAGLEPGSATPEQIAVVLARVLPGELGDRGIAGADRICAGLAGRISEIPAPVASHDSPESVFQRLGG